MSLLSVDATNLTGITDTDLEEFTSKLEVWEDYIVGTYLAIVCLMAVTLNALVIFTCFRNWKSLTRQDFYILNLACSDVLMPLSGFPLSISSSFSHQWLYGHTGCILYGFLGFYFGLVSIITLTIMGLARYIKICHPQINISSQNISRTTVVFPYVYALLWSGIPLLGWGSYSLEAYGTSCTLQWDENRLYITLMSVCCIATPAMSITFTYGLILLKCRRSTRNLRVWKAATNNNSNKMSTKDSYLIKITFAMCWGFLFSWMPYAVVSMWTAYGDGKLVPVRLTIMAVLLAKSSTVVNPVIYFLMSNKFRPLLLRTFQVKTSATPVTGSSQSRLCHVVENKRKSQSDGNTFNSDTFTICVESQEMLNLQRPEVSEYQDVEL